MGTHPIFESDFDCLTDLVESEMGRKQHTEVEPKETVQPRRSSRRKRANDDEDQPKPEKAEIAVNKIAESMKPEKIRIKRRTGSGSTTKLHGPEPVTTPRPSKRRKVNAVDSPIAEYSVTYGDKTIKFTELNFGAFRIKATKPQI